MAERDGLQRGLRPLIVGTLDPECKTRTRLHQEAIRPNFDVESINLSRLQWLAAGMGVIRLPRKRTVVIERTLRAAQPAAREQAFRTIGAHFEQGNEP